MNDISLFAFQEVLDFQNPFTFFILKIPIGIPKDAEVQFLKVNDMDWYFISGVKSLKKKKKFPHFLSKKIQLWTIVIFRHCWGWKILRLLNVLLELLQLVTLLLLIHEKETSSSQKDCENYTKIIFDDESVKETN